MLRTLLLLVTELTLLIMWLTVTLITVDMVVIMFLRGRWLGLRLVIIRLFRSKPPWAHRSLLNYVRMFAARYTPLRTNGIDFRIV